MKFFKAVFVLFAVLLLAGAARAQMRVHVIDVGQADAILIELPKHALLVDAGGENTGDDRDLDHLTKYLDSFFARRTDLKNTLYGVIISHPHKDHTEHLGAILEGYTVESLIEGGGFSGSGIQPVIAARKTIRDNNKTLIQVRDDTVNSAELIAWAKPLRQKSSARVRFLSGLRQRCNDENNESLVLRIDYKGKSVLLTGDSEVDDKDFNAPGNGCGGLIPTLLTRYADEPQALRANIYKMGHHGARNGTSDAFLRAVTPDYALISAGRHQTREPGQFHAFQFGHPNEDTIALLERFVRKSRNQPVNVYSLRGPRDLIENRKVRKNTYCTCWGSDVVLEVNKAGTAIRVLKGT
jgi:competence protein ComEC